MVENAAAATSRRCSIYATALLDDVPRKSPGLAASPEQHAVASPRRVFDFGAPVNARFDASHRLAAAGTAAVANDRRRTGDG
jgi:hypothetical protein